MKKLNDKQIFNLKLVMIIIVFFFLLASFYQAVFNPNKVFEMLSYGERASVYFSYFTTQSNYMVLIYLIFALFKKKFFGENPRYILMLATTTYISLTMIVFWVGIAASFGVATYTWYEWVITIFLHLVMPITMIVNYVLTCGKSFYKYEDHHKANLFFISSYMLFYLIFVLVRGHLRFLDDKPVATQFPYEFFNWYEYNGEWMLSAAIVIILSLSISAQYFYIWINNAVYHRKQVKIDARGINELYRLRVIKKYNLKKEKNSIFTRRIFICSLIYSVINLFITTLFFAEAIVNPTPEDRFIYIASSFAFVLIFFFLNVLLISLGYKRNLYIKTVLAIVNLISMFVALFWIIGPVFGMLIGLALIFSKKDLDIPQAKPWLNKIISAKDLT
ncbi:hypothetical protein NPX79_01970 [Spiroplasma endosymbiont of Anurida maritima]|uniref:hypothetical protein n=1 Tax=Spiroplasma endosymbiont of Anurida maritima TaxID=2967972 RepID=UPI0036D37AE7